MSLSQHPDAGALPAAQGCQGPGSVEPKELLLSALCPRSSCMRGQGQALQPQRVYAPEQGTAGLREGVPTKWAWAPAQERELMPSGGAADCGSSSPEGSRCQGQGA